MIDLNTLTPGWKVIGYSGDVLDYTLTFEAPDGRTITTGSNGALANQWVGPHELAPDVLPQDFSDWLKENSNLFISWMINLYSDYPDPWPQALQEMGRVIRHRELGPWPWPDYCVNAIANAIDYNREGGFGDVFTA